MPGSPGACVLKSFPESCERLTQQSITHCEGLCWRLHPGYWVMNISCFIPLLSPCLCQQSLLVPFPLPHAKCRHTGGRCLTVCLCSDIRGTIQPASAWLHHMKGHGGSAAQRGRLVLVHLLFISNKKANVRVSASEAPDRNRDCAKDSWAARLSLCLQLSVEQVELPRPFLCARMLQNPRLTEQNTDMTDHTSHYSWVI